MLKSMLFENISVGKFGGFGGIAYLCTRFRERVPAAAGVTRGADAGPWRGFEKKVSEKLAGFENTSYLCNVFRRTRKGFPE
jgi:hypothetical protein